MNFCNASVRSGRPKLDNFWINTSSNDLLGEFLADADEKHLELMKAMLGGQSVPAELHEDFSFAEIDAGHTSEMLMSLLCMTGYLTKAGETPDGRALLRIPNTEVRECLERKVKAFSARTAASIRTRRRVLAAPWPPGTLFQPGNGSLKCCGNTRA